MARGAKKRRLFFFFKIGLLLNTEDKQKQDDPVDSSSWQRGRCAASSCRFQVKIGDLGLAKEVPRRWARCKASHRRLRRLKKKEKNKDP